MIDFPIDELLDEEACLHWLEQRSHPDGLRCPHCNSGARRFAQQNGLWPSWRCKACDHYYTVLSGTVFEKTRQSPSKLVLRLRGIAKGEPKVEDLFIAVESVFAQNGHYLDTGRGAVERMTA